MTELQGFIMYYCRLLDEELELITSKFTYRTLKKGKYLLKKGQVCDELVYTSKGNFRIYYKDSNEKESTTWLIFDDMLATEFSSFITRQPTRFYVQAIADSEIYCITYPVLQELYNDIPAFREFGRKIAEEIVVGTINRVVSFQHETADKRYIKLQQRAEYLQKVPLKYLATFLGVTDTSLSRLRRKK